MEGESKYTTLMVARGGEWRGRRAIDCGGFVVIKGAAVDERKSLTNLVLLGLGIVNNRVMRWKREKKGMGLYVYCEPYI